jgi:LuxR family maltose regulon positive regulatory protein
MSEFPPARDPIAVGQAALSEGRWREARARFQQALARAALQTLGISEAGEPPCPLSERQLQVLRLVAEGLGDKDIADRLVLSEHTVHRHVANIYLRLGCSSRAAAVAHASRLGLL